ncbi:MAG: NtaA/DmoA family FMN-dependent monooxygenase [Pantoea sp.]|uniref:NtaA/DmoA family FMN-dependent monooxygenase n=1 Tax=Pantoea TaxID=53335 RepID=UPI0006616E55|nr:MULTISPECIES: NtaA/DmoA family FMN-dependent monooxygenase [Pantoea]MBS6435311.1 NtaA/DmoA family FMN-dependent monooxygenase [Pantoea sp.]MDU1574704.1 NtaA/DmoA family FMN-dependent monooxygenase [Pantoea sp.]MDU2729741.1 NtaA/DmoA family FMN-dependent monooxygenase [Pantoea sp.]MDU5472159.1 NtaA/DmoA family FMN-dependent monooxygenase [Pantoea sp.]MDU6079740.1 NtaA/DmoA family FMN-dependent monooxygenase [Pantoea sp.]
MTQPYRRKLKTLVGAASVIAASNDSAPDTGIRRAISLAKIAEREKITGLFTADLLQADPAGLAGTTGSQDPLIALAALSQATSHIGLIATVSTSWLHPYHLARQIGTLDHLSGGRAGWNAVTSSVGEENFGEGALPPPEARYARASEFIEVINALFDANQPDAVQRTASGGIKIDPAKLQAIHYRGDYFQVAGPLNVPPPPQRRPVQFQAGQSEAGVSLGARFAEVIYTSQPTFEAAQAFVADVQQRARRVGREQNPPLIMNSFHAIIGESDADVARRLREKHERINYDQGRLRVADMLGGEIDLRDLPLDQPLPAALIPALAQVHRRQGRAAIFRSFALEGLTLRELIIKAEETGHWFTAGTPEALADAIEQRYRAGVLDVISLHGLGQPDQEDLLLNGLLPELRRRDLLDGDYVGDDFRSSLELAPLPQL